MNLRMNTKPHGFYRKCNEEKFAIKQTQSYQRPARKPRNHDVNVAHLLSLSTHHIIAGLKLKKKPRLIQYGQFAITASQYHILAAFGFNKKWRSGLDWLTLMKLPTNRSKWPPDPDFKR